MSIKIVTDSTANLTAEEIAAYDIHVAALNVLVDGMSYKDGEPAIDKSKFYTILEQANALPKTSQPSIGTFLDIYDSFEEGTEIISIHVSEALSGTINAARQAGELSKNRVTIVDSQLADRGLAYQVLEAAKWAQDKQTKEAILAHIDDVRSKTELYLCVFTLDNLVKGGRVSRTKGILSSLLNMKVIFHFKNNVLDVIQKGRGVKSVQKWLADQYAQLETKNLKELAFSYVSDVDFIQEQVNAIKEKIPHAPFHVGFTTPTISIHTGQGAFAFIYYTE